MTTEPKTGEGVYTVTTVPSWRGAECTLHGPNGFTRGPGNYGAEEVVRIANAAHHAAREPLLGVLRQAREALAALLQGNGHSGTGELEQCACHRCKDARTALFAIDAELKE